jgi:hypothetical protein
MRKVLVLMSLVALAGTAFAGDPPIDSIVVDRANDSCELTVVTYDWDFSTGDHGFTHQPCEAGAIDNWAYGVPTNPEVPINVAVWGTGLAGDYSNDSGSGLYAPAFTVTESAYLMEVSHYFDTENNYDGCNVSVNGTVIQPYTPYPAVISTSTGFYAFCVDMEPGWTDGPTTSLDCFDLSAYMGQEVEIEFALGSDSSVSYPGWFIYYVKVGGQGGTPTEGTTWGAIKGLFQ